MTRTTIAMLALTASLALSACSAASANCLAASANCSVAPGTVAVETTSFNGEHVSVDVWAEAASGEGVTIVDVRTPEEYDFDHIPGAVNINLYSGVFESEVALLDPEASYAVYCHSGNRSREAIDVMTRLGITQTIGLEGGIDAWTTAGYALAAE